MWMRTKEGNPDFLVKDGVIIYVIEDPKFRAPRMRNWETQTNVSEKQEIFNHEHFKTVQIPYKAEEKLSYVVIVYFTTRPTDIDVQSFCVPANQGTIC